MSFRHTLALAVCLLMLCASSVSSACELNCSLPAGHHPSLPASSPQTTTAMSHSHCAHMLMRGVYDQWPNSITQTSGCVEKPCARPDVASLAVKLLDYPYLTDQLAAATFNGQKQLFNFQPTVSAMLFERQLSPSPPLSTVLQI